METSLVTNRGIMRGHLPRAPAATDPKELVAARAKRRTKKSIKRGSNLKSDASPANVDEERIDTKALPAAARRQLSRPRWCSDFSEKGCLHSRTLSLPAPF